MYGFLQVYGKKHLRKGETMPANGPDSGVGDTLSGTVDIDGATDALKNLIVFPVRDSQNCIAENRILAQPQNSPSFQCDRATYPDTPTFASQ